MKLPKVGSIYFSTSHAYKVPVKVLASSSEVVTYVYTKNNTSQFYNQKPESFLENFVLHFKDLRIRQMQRNLRDIERDIAELQKELEADTKEFQEYLNSNKDT